MSEITQAASSGALLIYDGDCGFCRWSVRRLRFMTGDRVDFAPYQEVAERFPDISRDEFNKSVFLIEPDGRKTRAAEAVCRSMAVSRAKRWPLWIYDHVPGASSAMEISYRAIARSRPVISPVIRLLFGRGSVPASHYITRRVFERGLGAIYLVAFLSLWVQIHGLIGSDGILPIADTIQTLKARGSSVSFWQFPTIAWWFHSDVALHWLCGVGTLLSVLAIFRVAPGPVFLLLWVLYLSMTVAGQVFLSFQWDILLLETGLLAVFFAPWSFLPRLSTEPPPSRVMLWLVRLLLFKLMFLSGMVKLVWEAEATSPNIIKCWTDLTALTYHYWTQCIPNPGGWFANQFPMWLQKYCCGAMFIIEIFVPFLMFIPRRPRLICFWLQVALQLVIISTGNYGFFNVLTIVLCFSLLDDAALAGILRLPSWKRFVEHAAYRRRPVLRPWLTVPIGLYVVFVNGLLIYDSCTYHQRLSPKLKQVSQFASSHVRSLNSYGLFRIMTTERREIVLEGSEDARVWKEYEFKYKPGDAKRPPLFVAPHQPRLDWQMWFAALGSYNSPRNGWFARFMDRVHQGSDDVLALLERNPFSDGPPRFLRAVIYDYRFTDFKTRRETGQWWTRSNMRLYAPVRERSSSN